MDYAVSGNELAAFLSWQRAPFLLGIFPLEMGLRSPGEDGLGALLFIGTLEKKGIASCRESAELSLSCERGVRVPDVKSMIEKENDQRDCFGFDLAKEAGGWDAAMTEEEIAEMEKKGMICPLSEAGRMGWTQEEADKAAFGDRQKLPPSLRI